MIRVQEADFDVGAELLALRGTNADIGAAASFVGYVRGLSEGDSVQGMVLEHYAGMTERELEKIELEARTRWRINNALIIHRVGPLLPREQIVLVATTSAHRADAFAACEYMMDALKSKAPFWKREQTPKGERWVETKATDDEALTRWGVDSPKNN